MINWLKDLCSKEWFRLVGVLLIGVTIGVLFYPTKRIEEKLTIKHQEEMVQTKEEFAKSYNELNDKYVHSLIENKEYHEQSEAKISKLTAEVRTLQSKQKTAHYKLVRPDGTIEEKDFTSSEVNETSQVVTQIQAEFKTKIDQIETKWETIHKERVSKIQKEYASKESNYKKTIDELEKSRVISVNEKRFGLEAGILNDKDYYGHATMDIWGPIFIGVHGELGSNDNKLGAGLGLRF